jgi:hypothetical protein
MSAVWKYFEIIDTRKTNFVIHVLIPKLWVELEPTGNLSAFIDTFNLFGDISHTVRTILYNHRIGAIHYAAQHLAVSIQKLQLGIQCPLK